jgi:hypothetical protein
MHFLPYFLVYYTAMFPHRPSLKHRKSVLFRLCDTEFRIDIKQIKL